ncbi:Exopolygalacturonase C [Venturia inaequalis]|nr:Exopolygalacturonase C [Venturia inaequalis]
MFKKVNEEYTNIGGAKYTTDFIKLAFSPIITDEQ